MFLIKTLKKILYSSNHAQIRGFADIFSRIGTASLIILFIVLYNEQTNWLQEITLFVVALSCFLLSHKLRGYLK